MHERTAAEILTNDGGTRVPVVDNRCLSDRIVIPMAVAWIMFMTMFIGHAYFVSTVAPR